MIVGTLVTIFSLGIASISFQPAGEVEPERSSSEMSSFEATNADEDYPLCDDGERPYTSTERPLWTCEVDGCSFMDDSCRHDENVCFDEHGSSLLEEGELCPHLTTRAKGALESFGNFLWCDGSYYCVAHNSIGLCIESVCLQEYIVAIEVLI